MKYESDYVNTGQGSDSDENDQSGLVGLDTGGSPNDSIKDLKPVKRKVIPLRQEEINLSDGEAKRKRLMMGLVLVLGIVLGFILLRPSGNESNTGMPDNTGNSSNKNVISESEVAGIWKVPEKISGSVRDITKSSKSKSEYAVPSDLPRLKVRGIVVYTDDNKSAIIEDMIVKIGDVIKGVKVYKITSDSVVFEKDGVRWTEYVE